MADGEIVAFKGRATSFERLQGRMGIRDPDVARRTGIAVYLYLFDVLELDGRDVRSLPLRERKQLLREAVRWHGHLRWTPHRVGDGEALLRGRLPARLGGPDRQAGRLARTGRRARATG